MIRSVSKMGVIITPSWYNSRKWSVVVWITEEKDKGTKRYSLETISYNDLPPFDVGHSRKAVGEMMTICDEILKQ